MSKLQQGFFFLLLLSVLPKEVLATSVRCQEPARTVCINSCGTSSCRAGCEAQYCGSDTQPGTPSVGNPYQPIQAPPLWAPPTYGFPQYYGPFFPSYDPDREYLKSVQADLRRQKEEIRQFMEFAKQVNEPVLLHVAQNALRNVQQQLDQVNLQLRLARNDYYPYGLPYGAPEYPVFY